MSGNPEAEQRLQREAASGEEARQQPAGQEELAPAVAESCLVVQAKQDPRAFARLYEENVDRIYAYIYHRVHNVQDAEDLTARTFYRALEKLETYEDRGLPFVAWLYRIAHNLIANWHRDRGKRTTTPLHELQLGIHGGELPESRLETRESHSALWAAINRLAPDRRDLLIYKYGSRLSNAEIGKLMGRTEGAVKALYFRTLAALRKDLEARGWVDPNDGGARE